MSRPDDAAGSSTPGTTTPGSITPIDATEIDAAIADLDRRLRRLHVTRRDRQALLQEIGSDLHVAAEDGVRPAVLIGPDVDTFVRESIEAGGYRLRSPDYPRLLAGGLVAAAVSVVVGYLLVVEVLTPVLSSVFTLDGRYPTAGPFAAYGGVALIGLLGVMVAARRLLAGRQAARETLVRSALLVPLGAAAGIAVVTALGRDPGYTPTIETVALQVLVVALGVAGALAVARWWAVRNATGDSAVG